MLAASTSPAPHRRREWRWVAQLWIFLQRREAMRQSREAPAAKSLAPLIDTRAPDSIPTKISPSGVFAKTGTGQAPFPHDSFPSRLPAT